MPCRAKRPTPPDEPGPPGDQPPNRGKVNAAVGATGENDGGELPFSGLAVGALLLVGGTLAGAGFAVHRLSRGQSPAA